MVSVLIAFSVKNFRSIAATQSINFISTSDTSHAATHCVATTFGAVPRLTRNALLFGPNGGGKSNFLHALRLMREFVVESHAFFAADIASRYLPFCSPTGTLSPTVFSVDLIIDRLRYRYKFSYDASRITGEELRVYRSQKSQRWFGRQLSTEPGEDSWAPFSSALTGPREAWRRATEKQSLFLSVAAHRKAPQLQPLLDWFQNKLDVANAEVTKNLSTVANRLRDPRFKARILHVLQSVDVPVTDVRVSADKNSSVELLYRRPTVPPMWIHAVKGSSGTCRLLQLLVPILDDDERDRFVAIDDFDAQLHPLVARHLLELVNKPAAARRRMQVLFVCHDSVLLDLDLLRRDEVWLMETDKTSASRVTALVDYSPRRQEIVAKSYLRGRFGAVPKIKSSK